MGMGKTGHQPFSIWTSAISLISHAINSTISVVSHGRLYYYAMHYFSAKH
jgi:hypothetical protein